MEDRRGRASRFGSSRPIWRQGPRGLQVFFLPALALSDSSGVWPAGKFLAHLKRTGHVACPELPVPATVVVYLMLCYVFVSSSLIAKRKLGIFSR
jgi:hypothetical protein